MCDCDQYEPDICYKCWGSFTYCECESLKLRRELDEVKKELAGEKKRSKQVLDAYMKWVDSKDCVCEPAYCAHLVPLRSALDSLRFGPAIAFKKEKTQKYNKTVKFLKGERE